MSLYGSAADLSRTDGLPGAVVPGMKADVGCRRSSRRRTPPEQGGATRRWVAGDDSVAWSAVVVVAAVWSMILLASCSSPSAESVAYRDLFVSSAETVADTEFGIYALVQINGTALGDDRDRFRLWFEEDVVHLAVECSDGEHVGVSAPIALDRDGTSFRTLEDHDVSVILDDGERCGIQVAWTAGVSYSLDGRTLTLEGPINRFVMDKLSD